MNTFHWRTNQKVVEEYEIICDWLANRECLFPGESSTKIYKLGVK